MRDTQLVQIRPDLGLDSTHSSREEAFQNNTLRPILKLQHPLLIALFRQGIARQMQAFHQLPRPERQAVIAQVLRKDHRLRHLLAGAVIGHFTIEEYQAFMEKESELMRRLTGLLVQRLQSVEA